MPADAPVGSAASESAASAISARGLTCAFGHGKRRFTAVDSVDFDIADKEIVSIVGESGSGKSTLARMLLGLQKPTAGDLQVLGRPLARGTAHWRVVQAVFQDPFSCFNQFFTIKSQLRSAFKLFDQKPSPEEMRRRIDEALLAVNLDPSKLEGKYPFELSGGQMQRLLLARIHLIRPRILVADEPTSMVDACSRANILDFLLDLNRKRGMTILFITHDIGLAYYVSNRIFIMHRGRIVEQGPPESVIFEPRDEYTRRLLDDVPTLGRPWVSRRRAQAGQVKDGRGVKG
jgi:peptide/nickel transport system ATP-binding protein